jgi:hypothetical protein
MCDLENVSRKKSLQTESVHDLFARFTGETT